MGAVNSIQYSGSGTNGNFGQAILAEQDWPLRELTSYSRVINYDQGSSSEVIEFAVPVFGGQRQNPVVNGDVAWNVGPNGPAPAPGAGEERQLRIWLTPHGFLKAAAGASDAMLTQDTEGNSTVMFTAMDKYQVTGTINAQNLVTKVETKIANPVLGDTPVVAMYSDYKDFNGVQFPTTIVVEEGGSPAWNLTIASVEPNAAGDFPVPEAAQNAAAPPVTVQSAQLAPGVWHVTGGSHHSLVVEFPEYIAVVEGPLNEARSEAVIAEAKRLVPNKPINYVISTHHHFDHSGGLRTYVAEGATVVTHESNVNYFRNSFSAPATLVPDRQSTAQATPKIEGVSDKYTLTAGNQTIEVYNIAGDSHTDELLVAFLPGPGILVEGDAFSPGPAGTPPPSPAPPNAVNLYDKLQALGLNVRTIAPIHGRGAVPIAELRRFAGRG
jgi:glyoxylase-like metal-dependent hydrolase (beta-lactamase superfamily II)